jgi:hypothetical protein
MLGDVKALGGAEPPPGLNERIKQSISLEAPHKVESDSGSGVGELSILRRLGAFRVAAAAAAILFATWTIWGERGDQQSTSSKLTETATTETAAHADRERGQLESLRAGHADRRIGRLKRLGVAVVEPKIVKPSSRGAQERSQSNQAPAPSTLFSHSPSITSQVSAFLKDDVQRSVNGRLQKSAEHRLGAGLENQLLAKVNEILAIATIEPLYKSTPLTERSRGRAKEKDLNKSSTADKFNEGAEFASSPTARVVFLRSVSALEKVQQLCQTTDQKLIQVTRGTDGVKTKGPALIEHWKVTLSEQAAETLEVTAQRWGAVSVQLPTAAPKQQHSVESKEAAKPNHPKPRMTLHFLLPVYRE